MNALTHARNDLFFLGSEYESLYAAMQGEVNEDGEITVDGDRIAEEMNALQGTAQEKAVGAASVYLEEESEAKRIKSAIDRLQALYKAKTRATDKLKECIDNFCQTMGIEKLDGGLVKISYRKSTRTVIDNELALTDEYCRIKREPDKTAIGAALKAGKEVNGAHIEEGLNIQIK